MRNLTYFSFLLSQFSEISNFLKLAFRRDYSCNLTQQGIINPSRYQCISVQKYSHHLTLFSCTNVYCFLTTLLYSCDRLKLQFYYYFHWRCLKYVFYSNIDNFHSIRPVYFFFTFSFFLLKNTVNSIIDKISVFKALEFRITYLRVTQLFVLNYPITLKSR